MNNLGNYCRAMVQGIVGLTMTAIAFVGIKMLTAFVCWISGINTFIGSMHNSDSTAFAFMATLVMAIAVTVGVFAEDN